MIKSPSAPRRPARPSGLPAPRRLLPPDEFDAWLDQRLREIFALPETLPPPPAAWPPAKAD